MSNVKRVLANFAKSVLISLLVLSSASAIFSSKVNAAVTNPVPTAKVSFTFDDGYADALNQAAPALAAYGLTGTNYVTTGCVGMTTVPNTCRADNDKKYMTWAQIATLRNTYGWEIGSHSATHPYLASFDAEDGQAAALTQAQVIEELTKSKSDLAAHGINATAFASPYGDYTNATLAQIAKLYTSHRGFADQRNNDWPYNDYLLNNMQVQAGVTVAQVKAKIDDAIANKRWLVLTFHDVKAKPSNNVDDYEYSTANLKLIAAYVKSKQTAGVLQSTNISQGLTSGDTNLLPNSTFNSGITAGWTTDSAASFWSDGGNNGSLPGNSVKSIKFSSNSIASKHLFSPKVAVNPDGSYLLKSFLNVQTVTVGSVGFYIDEYDAAGNWISGQYKKSESSAFVETINFGYNPSSTNVRSASLQVIASGTGLKGYFDNAQWLPITTGTPPVQPTNLIANGTFDAGIAGGWRTDNTSTYTANSANHGAPSNITNSVALQAGTVQSHLFSPQVNVSNTKTYSIASYLNLISRTSGEVGFYIDEYDVAGNWISGQYKTGINTLGVRDIAFSYTPSSASVAKASLQVILVGNSGITAYFDDVRWY